MPEQIANQKLREMVERLERIQETTRDWPAWRKAVTYPVPGVVVEQAGGREVSRR